MSHRQGRLAHSKSAKAKGEVRRRRRKREERRAATAHIRAQLRAALERYVR